MRRVSSLGPGDRAGVAQGRREARGVGGAARARRCRGRGVRPRRGAGSRRSGRSRSELESAERVERSAEVMRRLKRDEARALMLKAEGLSYVEIGERLGLDVHEGQQVHHGGTETLPSAVRGARDGRRVRAAGSRAGLAGRGRGERRRAARHPAPPPQLRGVPGDGASPPRLAAAAGHRAAASGRGGRAGPGPVRAAARAARLGRRRRAPSDAAGGAARRGVPAVAGGRAVKPSGATRVLGRAAATCAAGSRRRCSGSRAPTSLLGVHAAASSGGGRVASIAALIGVCVSGVGAGTYCVATALLPDPKPAIRAEAKPSKHLKKRAATRKSKTAPPSSNVRLARAQSTATPSARAQAPKPKTRRTPSRQQPTQTDEFSFETAVLKNRPQSGPQRSAGTRTSHRWLRERAGSP